MIEIEDLSVQFGGVKPIDGLTVKLTRPIVGLIGPNGAGKTTLLNVLSGFVTPSRGHVKVDGQLLTGVPAHRRATFGLRRTFQTDQIAEDLSLKQNVQAIADHVRYDSYADYDKAVLTAIDFVGLSHRLNRRRSARGKSPSSPGRSTPQGEAGSSAEHHQTAARGSSSRNRRSAPGSANCRPGTPSKKRPATISPASSRPRSERATRLQASAGCSAASNSRKSTP